MRRPTAAKWRPPTHHPILPLYHSLSPSLGRWPTAAASSFPFGNLWKSCISSGLLCDVVLVIPDSNISSFCLNLESLMPLFGHWALSRPRLLPVKFICSLLLPPLSHTCLSSTSQAMTCQKWEECHSGMALGSRTLPRHSLRETGGHGGAPADLLPAYPGTLGRRHGARSLRLIEAALRNSGVFHTSCQTLPGLTPDQNSTGGRASIRRASSIKSLPQPNSSSCLPPRPILVTPPTPPTHRRWTSSQGGARMTRSVGPPTSSPIVVSNIAADMSQSFDMAVLEEDIVLSWLGQARLEEYHGHFILAGYDLPTITRFETFTHNIFLSTKQSYIWYFRFTKPEI